MPTFQIIYVETVILHPLMHYYSTTTLNCRRLHYIRDEKDSPKEGLTVCSGFHATQQDNVQIIKERRSQAARYPHLNPVELISEELSRR